MYEVGRVYIWQNQVGQFAFLNGVETTVIGPEQEFVSRLNGEKVKGYPTDTKIARYEDSNAFASAGDLRPKDPPKGEQSILDLFKLPELEPA